MIIELNKIGISCKEEIVRDIIYEGKILHRRRLDLLVEDIILLELKARKEMDNAEVNQILNYLRIFKIETGLLLNFGTPSLFFKRFIHTVSG